MCLRIKHFLERQYLCPVLKRTDLPDQRWMRLPIWYLLRWQQVRLCPHQPMRIDRQFHLEWQVLCLQYWLYSGGHAMCLSRIGSQLYLLRSVLHQAQLSMA